MASAASVAVAASLASGGVESMGWLNDLVAQLWEHINVAGAAIVKETVEPMFKEMLPGPLSTLRFEKIDLGRVPIKFDNIDVHTKTKGIIKLCIDIVWDGDCDIDLHADRIGGLGVQSVKLRGRMSFLLCPLVDRLPLVSAVQFGFINQPELELDFTGLAQVADFSFVAGTIRKIILDILTSLLVLPNRMLIKMDPAANYFDTYQDPLGIVRVTAVKGHGFKVQRYFLGKDVPDVNCTIKFGADPVRRTSTKKNTVAPVWNESFDFLLSDKDQLICIDAFDDDGLTRADYLGSGEISVDDLLLAGKTFDLELEKKGVKTGTSITVKCDIFRFTPDISSFESPKHQGKNLLCGLLTVSVARAFNIPVPKEEAASQVKVTFGSLEFLTPSVYDAPGIDALNPSYDSSFRVPITAKMAAASLADIKFTLTNKTKIIGSIQIEYSTILEASDRSVTETYEVGQGASLELRVSLRGVQLAE